MRAHFLMRLPLVLAAVTLSSAALAECDCTKFPFKPTPPCQNECFAKLLNDSTPGSLKAVVGFPDTLTQRINIIRSQSAAKLVWQDFQHSLTAEELATVQQGFAKLDNDKIVSLNVQSRLQPDGAEIGRKELTAPETNDLKAIIVPLPKQATPKKPPSITPEKG